MKIISNEDYELFMNLKSKAQNIYTMSSAKDIKNLEDDIDLPIKRCVAMLALLGCEPTFSCCGFDYDGQPIHKSHQKGFPYIRIKKNDISNPLAKLDLKGDWRFRDMGNEWALELTTFMNPHWRNPSCIHYSEECVIGINYLDDMLSKLSPSFRQKVVLEDTNLSHASRLKFWQYPPKNPWTILKDDYQ